MLKYKHKYDYPYFAVGEAGSKRESYAVLGRREQSQDSNPCFLVSCPLLYLVACFCNMSHSELIFIQIQDFLNYCCVTSYAAHCKAVPVSFRGGSIVHWSQGDYFGQIILNFLSSRFIIYQIRILILPQI